MFRILRKSIENVKDIIEAVAEITKSTTGAVETRHMIQEDHIKRELVERAWKALMDGSIRDFKIGDIHITAADVAEEDEAEDEDEDDMPVVK